MAADGTTPPDLGQPLAVKHSPTTAQSDYYLMLCHSNAYIHAHTIAEGEAALRYKSKHQTCASLCVSRRLCFCYATGEFFPSVPLCSPRIPDQPSEKRQLCLALCLSQLCPLTTSSHSSLRSSAAHRKHTLQDVSSQTVDHRYKMMEYSWSTSGLSALSLRPTPESKSTPQGV